MRRERRIEWQPRSRALRLCTSDRASVPVWTQKGAPDFRVTCRDGGGDSRRRWSGGQHGGVAAGEEG